MLLKRRKVKLKIAGGPCYEKAAIKGRELSKKTAEKVSVEGERHFSSGKPLKVLAFDEAHF